MFSVQAALVFRLRESAHGVSIVWLASLLPAIVIGPVAGVFADRWNPRRTMIVSDCLRAVLVLLLAASTRSGAGTSTHLDFIRLCSICFAISCVSAFFVPAQAVVIPRLIKREELLPVSVLMQQTMHVARIASPAVAGTLVVRFGENACYWGNSASFLVSAALLTNVSCHVLPTAIAPKASHVARDMRSGLAFLLTNSEVSFATCAMAGGTFAAGCYSSLVAIYIRDVLHATAASYAIAGSLTAAGTLAGTLVAGKIVNSCSRQTLIATGMGIVGACILSLALYPSQLGTFVGAAGIGLGASSAMIAASAVLKEFTPEELRGRVSSVSVSMMSAAQAAAMLFAGSCATWLGVRGVYAVSAAMLLAQPAYQCFRRGRARSGPSACFQTLL